MRPSNHRMLAAAVITAAMLCNTTVCAWASAGNTNTVILPAEETSVLKSALTSGLEAQGQKPDLPRLLPSDTKVKAVGKITGKDIPLYFDPTEESNVYILLPLDALVSVMEDLDDWFRVSYNDCTGFVLPEYVELLKRSETFQAYGVVDADEMPLLKEANGDSEVLATLKDGDRVEVTGLENGWFAVKSGDKTGYVTGDDLDLTMEKEAPKPKTTANKTQAATAVAGSTSESNLSAGSGSGSDIAAFAQQYLGTPYAYGGAGLGGFDCSGFTMFVFSHFGVNLAHGATPQLNNGYAVSMSELQPGDLVFFFGTYNTSSAASHVGIYIGGGQFIHASSSRGVIISSLSENYYANRYLAARRVF